MIGSTRSVRVFAFTQPTDMRKGFDGLYGMVSTHLEQDPLSGDLFLFVARNRKRAKVLMWDGTGLCLYAKRIEKGRFARLWAGEEPNTLELTSSELALFLEGSGRRTLSLAHLMRGPHRRRPKSHASQPERSLEGAFRRVITPRVRFE